MDPELVARLRAMFGTDEGAISAFLAGRPNPVSAGVTEPFNREDSVAALVSLVAPRGPTRLPVVNVPSGDPGSHGIRYSDMNRDPGPQPQPMRLLASEERQLAKANATWAPDPTAVAHYAQMIQQLAKVRGAGRPAGPYGAVQGAR